MPLSFFLSFFLLNSFYFLSFFLTFFLSFFLLLIFFLFCLHASFFLSFFLLNSFYFLSFFLSFISNLIFPSLSLLPPNAIFNPATFLTSHLLQYHAFFFHFLNSTLKKTTLSPLLISFRIAFCQPPLPLPISPFLQIFPCINSPPPQHHCLSPQPLIPNHFSQFLFAADILAFSFLRKPFHHGQKPLRLLYRLHPHPDVASLCCHPAAAAAAAAGLSPSPQPRFPNPLLTDSHRSNSQWF